MKSIGRYNLLTALAALFVIALLFSAITFFSGDILAPFEWSTINPAEAVQGIIFAMSFGLGLSVLASITILSVVVIILWVVMTLLLRAMLR